MTKKITQQQIEAILQAFYQVNAGVQVFEGVKKMLVELPSIEETQSVEPEVKE